MTKEQFTKILESEGMSSLDIQKLWASKPSATLNEEKLRGAAKRIAEDRARGVNFL